MTKVPYIEVLSGLVLAVYGCYTLVGPRSNTVKLYSARNFNLFISVQGSTIPLDFDRVMKLQLLSVRYQYCWAIAARLD